MKKTCLTLALTTSLLTGCATSKTDLSNSTPVTKASAVVIAVNHFNNETSKVSSTGAVVDSNGGINKQQPVVNTVELTIQESNGNLMKVKQPQNANYFVGQYVTIVKQGQKAQITPQ